MLKVELQVLNNQPGGAEPALTPTVTARIP
jgi:hypothetical protein